MFLLFYLEHLAAPKLLLIKENNRFDEVHAKKLQKRIKSLKLSFWKGVKLINNETY